MNELINGNAIKMTSIEIAELVGSRPDNVKISIERPLNLELFNFLHCRFSKKSIT